MFEKNIPFCYESQQNKRLIITGIHRVEKMQKEYCLFLVHCLTEGWNRHVSPWRIVLNVQVLTPTQHLRMCECQDWIPITLQRVPTEQVDGNTKHMVSVVTLCLQRGSKQTWNKYKLAIQGCVKAVQNITPWTCKQTLKIVSENDPNIPGLPIYARYSCLS